MKKVKLNPRIQIIYKLLIAAYFLSACMKEPLNISSSQTATSDISKGYLDQVKDSDSEWEIVYTPTVPITDERITITQNLLKEITEINSFKLFFPYYYHVSDNGRIAAVGDLEGIRIFDTRTMEILMEIPVKLPDCEFGKGRVFRLNYDGLFIGIATPEFVQVWQVGGGIIFEWENRRYSSHTEDICGLDVPELSISPDGKTLVLTGFEKQGSSPVYFFRTIDIRKNEVIYEYDGDEKNAYGMLNDFPNLGFSPDGRIFQTFDPRRFVLSEWSLHMAFRFWDTSDWSEIDRKSSRLVDSLAVGNRLFGVSENQSVVVRNRMTGRWVARLEPTPCTADYPCSIQFSADGLKAVVFSQKENTINYRNKRFADQIEIWDLEKGEVDREVDGLFRNLDGVYTNEDNEVAVFQIDQEGLAGSWWTNQEYFSGLINNEAGEMVFAPIQNMCGENTDCSSLQSCLITSDAGGIRCREEYLGINGIPLSVQVEDDRAMLQEHTEGSTHIIGELLKDVKIDQKIQRIRLLGYSDANKIGFYCLDVNYRQLLCAVVDFSTDVIIQEFDDISFLRFSPNGQYAAFIDQVENRLRIMEISTGKITTKTPYQARAFDVNPVFINGGEVIYIVQDLKISDRFSIEYIDLDGYKVLSREKLHMDNVTPTVLAAGKEDNIWFFGDEGGFIRVVDPDTGIEIHHWQAHDESVIGLIFNEAENTLVSMDEAGTVSIWGVIKN